MKKLICLIAIMCLVFPYASAEIDLSGMTYAELVALKDKINLAIWNSKEWQEVTVPQGIWVVGEDIPAGHWNISAPSKAMYTSIECGEKLMENGISISFMSKKYINETLYGINGYMYTEGARTSIDIVLENGMYVIIDGNNAIFSPFSGKPDLGFK